MILNWSNKTLTGRQLAKPLVSICVYLLFCALVESAGLDSEVLKLGFRSSQHQWWILARTIMDSRCPPYCLRPLWSRIGWKWYALFHRFQPWPC